MSGVLTLPHERVIVIDGRDARRVIDAPPEDFREALGGAALMRHLARLTRRGDLFPDLRAEGSGVPGYIVSTGTSAIALSAATAKTVMYVNAAANVPTLIAELSICFDGVTAANTPALIEWCLGTKASNSTPGTGSTTFTPLQVRGWPVNTAQAAAANACSSEPTVLTPNRQWLVTPNGGLLVVQFPLGRELTLHNIASTSGLQGAVRCNAPQTVNVRGYLDMQG